MLCLAGIVGGLWTLDNFLQSSYTFVPIRDLFGRLGDFGIEVSGTTDEGVGISPSCSSSIDSLAFKPSSFSVLPGLSSSAETSSAFPSSCFSEDRNVVVFSILKVSQESGH